MTLILLAFGVAMDCTAVAGAYALRRICRADLVKLAFTFGAFQACTAFLGALGGTAVANRLGGWDAWVAFGLLLGVGAHMIHEAVFDRHDDAPDCPTMRLPEILVLGVATSIDSLAVGATLPTLGLPVLLSAAVIGLVSFLMSFVGAWAGVRVGERLGPAVEILGGVVLIGIGVRALWLHYIS
jgi:manganese efflux pump family protein